jgi:hypothetical protein
LSLLTASCFKYERLEYPVPKSSIANRTPVVDCYHHTSAVLGEITDRALTRARSTDLRVTTTLKASNEIAKCANAVDLARNGSGDESRAMFFGQSYRVGHFRFRIVEA